ncbi:helix-turn-helix transcriptional regulator [uncultured Thomasclavelia sp.]|uniref:helix-turn-helix transcriptional regulator n=1 Tax=uncultured Thomasclavelia sp. TaxID=3025759 RepID=UPI0025DDD6F4|nr:helix-turn-helix transcriptional regulator [uncultured Thomasclavelia sp.]
MIIRFIKDNFKSKITVADIAKSANISKRECFRKFNAYVNISPINYLETIRLDHAFECGFSSTSYFCKRFKKLTNITPKEYRISIKQ